MRLYLIVCPLLFIAGFADAIVGSGLISLPAYLLAFLPIYKAIATNNLSSVLASGGISHSESARNSQSQSVYNSQCTSALLSG